MTLALSIFYQILRQPGADTPHPNADGRVTLLNDEANAHVDARTSLISDLPLAFLRLCNLNEGVIERLGRYEAALWRQTVQVLLLLKSRRIDDESTDPAH